MTCTKRKKRIACAAFLCALPAFLLGGAFSGENPLLAERPIPDSVLYEAVIDVEQPQQARMDAMTSVAEQATDEDLDERLEWLVEVAQTVEATPVTRGHALQLIATLGTEPEGMGAWLASSALDAAQSTEWRMVSIASLERFYWLAGEEDAGYIVTALAGLSRDADPGIGGTALITLSRLGSRLDGARQSTVEIMRDLMSASVGSEMLFAVIQSAVAIDDPTLLPEIRAVAQDTANELRIRMAAVGALGQIGTEEDIAIIQSVRNSSPVLRKVAANALASLSSRLASIE